MGTMDFASVYAEEIIVSIKYKMMYYIQIIFVEETREVEHGLKTLKTVRRNHVRHAENKKRNTQQKQNRPRRNRACENFLVSEINQQKKKKVAEL